MNPFRQWRHERRHPTNTVAIGCPWLWFGPCLALGRARVTWWLKQLLGCSCRRLRLGVAAIAAVGTVSSAILAGLDRDARSLLGGDVDLRSIHRPVSAEVKAYVRQTGSATEIIGMRAMAEKNGLTDGRRVLVEMKAVGDGYPLVGQVELLPAMDLTTALAVRDGLPGTVIDRSLAARLEVEIGDQMRVGDGYFELRALIEKEPDRAVSAFATFGPRLMIAMDALAATGLVREGSLIRYHDRVRLPNDVDVSSWISDLKARFPDAGFQIRSRDRAAPGFSSFVDRLGLYLSLVGLTALLVGRCGDCECGQKLLGTPYGDDCDAEMPWCAGECHFRRIFRTGVVFGDDRYRSWVVAWRFCALGRGNLCK